MSSLSNRNGLIVVTALSASWMFAGIMRQPLKPMQTKRKDEQESSLPKVALQPQDDTIVNSVLHRSWLYTHPIREVQTSAEGDHHR